ncbi:hypothetical protein IAU59_003912 [Kwoniella sp. CBS 9459]
MNRVDPVNSAGKSWPSIPDDVAKTRSAGSTGAQSQSSSAQPNQSTSAAPTHTVYSQSGAQTNLSGATLTPGTAQSLYAAASALSVTTVSDESQHEQHEQQQQQGGQ